jgi:hypothetical protein
LADDWKWAAAVSLAELGDSTCELVTRWLGDARAEGRPVPARLGRYRHDFTPGARRLTRQTWASPDPVGKVCPATAPGCGHGSARLVAAL